MIANLAHCDRRMVYRYPLLLIVGLALAGVGANASAQTILLAGGFGGGGGETANAQYRVSGIVGESLSGVSLGPRIVHGTGFWFAAAGSVVGVANESESTPDEGIPARYQLDQNYPNPFNPSTLIRFGLPEDAQVELAVYNVLGRRVRVLVDRQLAAGWHTAVWDGRNVDGSPASSGLYLYQMRTENYSVTRRMMLVK